MVLFVASTTDLFTVANGPVAGAYISNSGLVRNDVGLSNATVGLAGGPGNMAFGNSGKVRISNGDSLQIDGVNPVNGSVSYYQAASGLTQLGDDLSKTYGKIIGADGIDLSGGDLVVDGYSENYPNGVDTLKSLSNSYSINISSTTITMTGSPANGYSMLKIDDSSGRVDFTSDVFNLHINGAAGTVAGGERNINEIRAPGDTMTFHGTGNTINFTQDNPVQANQTWALIQDTLGSITGPIVVGTGWTGLSLQQPTDYLWNVVS
jgi:hypothetical protein